ncbi:hypothetical protein [Streptomyces sp. ODS28]|uniref:hypothetical protein n=1 Tax=Streptomyces sp. ODS28 TaxID=3136688 RepID=UPI0031EEEEA3
MTGRQPPNGRPPHGPGSGFGPGSGPEEPEHGYGSGNGHAPDSGNGHPSGAWPGNDQGNGPGSGPRNGPADGSADGGEYDSAYDAEGRGSAYDSAYDAEERGSAYDSGPGSGSGSGPGDQDLSEEALRQLLRDSVRDIEPSPEALPHLRRAVPARRTHRRQALIGAAAAVVLGGAGVPTLVSAGFVPGVGDDEKPASAESASPHGADGDGGHSRGKGASSHDSGKDTGDKGTGGHGTGGSGGSGPPSPSAGSSAGTGADPSDTLAVSAPACERDQLGDGSAESAASDGGRKVYGSFRVVNTSPDTCTVEGEGTVLASGTGRAESARVQVVDHTSGDPAAGLPDPATSPEELVLKPGQAYRVEFAWIPDDCPASGSGSGSPSPKSADEPDGSASPGTDGGGTSSGGDSGGGGTPSTGGSETGGTDSGGSGSGGDQGGTGDSGGSGDGGAGSVKLTHTPDAGDPQAAETSLNGSCTGTVYRTGVLPDQ